MLHKKLGEKIGGIGYYDEYRPPRTSAAGHYTTPGDKCQEKYFRQIAQKKRYPSSEGYHYIIIQTGVYRYLVGELKIPKAVIPHESQTFHFSQCGAGQVLYVIAHIFLVFLGCLTFGNIQNFDGTVFLVVFTAKPSTNAIFCRADFQKPLSALLQ